MNAWKRFGDKQPNLGQPVWVKNGKGHPRFGMLFPSFPHRRPCWRLLQSVRRLLGDYQFDAVFPWPKRTDLWCYAEPPALPGKEDA